MQKRNEYSKIHFDRMMGKIPRRIVALIVVPVVFTVLWIVLPSSAVYWLSLLLMVILTYCAGFGWEQALAHLIRFLQAQQRRERREQ